MCGIAGYFGKKKHDQGSIDAALQTMSNRGPDHRASFKHEGRRNVVLCHSRLSIIDLDARSNQPFQLGDCIIAFNGEIYNYVELKEKLVKDGVRFSTNSDTEVLMHYYLKYGEKCVEHFEGMWSFAIYDMKKEILFLSRDRFAEKPLYYFTDNEGFYFASETNTLRALVGKKFEVNTDHLLRFMVNGHKSLYKTSDTFYRGIKEIPYASNCTISSDGKTEIFSYWKPQFKPTNMSRAEAVEGIKQRLINSLKIRLRSDVPLAFCLSGGVDSASLVSIAAKVFNANVNTFSIIDSDQRYDEDENIQATINDTGCKSTKIMLSPKDDNLGRLKALINYHDAPVATISYFVHSLLSEAISKNGYKISISGTAADELFTGYYDHFNLHLYETRNSPDYEEYLRDWKAYPAKYVRHPAFQDPELYFKDPSVRDHIYLNNEEFASYLKKDFTEEFTEYKFTDSLLRNRMMNELFHEVVRVILHEDDLNSMLYSIENRSPFLDTELFNFAYSIPGEMLIKNGYAKSLLREAMAGILNDKVRLEREKKGFNASINSIIDFDNKEHVDFILDDGPIYHLVDKNKIEAIMKKKEYPNSYKKFLFNFINARIFLDIKKHN
jgi:asparagine synthase (glutamine-hydrolysing)